MDMLVVLNVHITHGYVAIFRVHITHGQVGSFPCLYSERTCWQLSIFIWLMNMLKVFYVYIAHGYVN